MEFEFVLPLPCVVESTELNLPFCQLRLSSTSFGRAGACRLLDTRWHFSIKVQKSSCPRYLMIDVLNLPARISGFLSLPLLSPLNSEFVRALPGIGRQACLFVDTAVDAD
jgi:hypothetical protein